MTTPYIAAGKGTVDDVVARIERMPISSWHLKARFIVGVATFFDGFDALAIAYVLPVLAPLWHLTPSQIGLLLSASFFGQLLAALFFGWFAERYGRIPAIVWSTLIYSVMSLACAFAWDFNSLLVLRTLQGIGIGGEVPVAIAYIAELSRAQGRGRFLLLYEIVFPLGLVAAVLIGVWVVPQVGWRWLFVIGALPALVVFFMQPALASNAWATRRGRCGCHHDRKGRGALDRASAAAASGRHPDTRTLSFARRPVWSRISCPHPDHLGDLELLFLLQLRAGHLAADRLSDRVQAERRPSSELHAGDADCRSARDVGLCVIDRLLPSPHLVLRRLCRSGSTILLGLVC